MHKLLYMSILLVLMLLFFSAEARNVNFDSLPTDPVLTDVGVPGGSSLSDSLALLTSGLIMLISASFLKRLSG
jgi:hypothetical protein